MTERRGLPVHRMMPPSDVAGMVLTMVTTPPTSVVPEMVVVPRNEPDLPR
jgi:NADP-dependent 3-hydroxy acid dehydrogenase YdfG